MRIENARRWRPQCNGAEDVGLERRHILATAPLQVAHAVGDRGRQVALELADILVVGRDDQLADTPMGHTLVCAIAVQALLAGHAQGGLQRARRIVDARMNNLGVTAAGMCQRR